MSGGEYPGPHALSPIKLVASECDLYGHTYEVRDRGPAYSNTRAPSSRRPESVFCSRCGLSWKVERG